MKTSFVINDKLMLDIETILFAELAAPNAMGAAGVASIFFFEGEKLKHYEFDVHKANEESSYNALDQMFKVASAEGVLDYIYGGYGNHVFKKAGIKFERNDDNATLIYVAENKKRYKIQVSNLGVYSHIIKNFAISPVKYEIINDVLENNTIPLDDDEKAFLEVYVEACENFENGTAFINTTAVDYNDAISFIKFNHGENPEGYEADEYAGFGVKAIQKYRLKYVVDKIGWVRLHRFMNRFLRNKKGKLFDAFDEILEEKQKFSKKFMNIRKGKTENTKISGFGNGTIKHLFDYPAIISFSEEARKTIHDEILKLSVSELRANADEVTYYLMNYFWHLFDWGFDEVEEVVWFVIDNCPNDDFNGTGTDNLFWIASHIINTHWKRLSGKKNEDFEKQIIVHFTPRVGGIWPIIHFGEFKMNNPVGDFIMRESIGYLVSVERERWLPGIEEFLKTEEALNSEHPAIRHFAEEIQGKTS